MQAVTRKPAPRRALNARQQCALAFTQGLLSGPAGAAALKKNSHDPLIKVSRLSLRFADTFLAESKK